MWITQGRLIFLSERHLFWITRYLDRQTLVDLYFGHFAFTFNIEWPTVRVPVSH